MKKLFIISLISLMISCNKENYCVYCTFGEFNGKIKPPETYCGKDASKHRFIDADGNSLNAHCIPTK